MNTFRIIEKDKITAHIYTVYNISSCMISGKITFLVYDREQKRFYYVFADDYELYTINPV